jgi:group I intron endonuclease
MKSGVYKITNIKNGKFYIGSTKDFETRWKDHTSSLNKNRRKPNIRFQNAWNKHKEESFIFEIVEFVEIERLIEREQYYLDTLTPWKVDIGYNTRKIADRNTGMEVTRETRELMSRIRKGKKFSEQHKKNLSESLKGRMFSEETIKKMSKNHADISGKNNPMYGIRLTGTSNGNSKKVTCITTGETFETMKEAGEAYGIKCYVSIGQACRGKFKTSGIHPKTGEKLKWKFAD